MTSEGHSIKRQKITDQYSEELSEEQVSLGMATVNTPKGPAQHKKVSCLSATASSVSDSLCSPAETAHSKIMKLFRKKETTSGITTSLKKQPMKKPSAARRLTIFDCDTDIITVPRDKTKRELRDKLRMCQIELFEEDSQEIVLEKVKELFSHYKNDEIKFMSATKSNDLFCLKLPEDWSAKSLLDIYGTKPIYVGSMIKTCQDTPVTTSKEATKELSGCMALVKPTVRVYATVIKGKWFIMLYSCYYMYCA